jgi:hypothetical protein
LFRVASNYRRGRLRVNKLPHSTDSLPDVVSSKLLPLNTKILAISIFLIFFIENGTLGLLPRNFYFVYRNVRISDLLLYATIVYSIYCNKEIIDLWRSRSLWIVKYFMLYLFFQFIISSIAYKVDIIEYFFRLKYLWMSMLVLPYMLLLKRGGIGYLIKLILPVAIISNIFYIASATTGIALLPDMGIVQQDLPGGLKVFRVYGGTFFGEIFFLGIIFNWNENNFKLSQVPFAILFIFPHILAFGRNAWVFMTFAIVFIILWSSFKNRNFQTLFRQVFVILIFGFIFKYFFTQLLPESDKLSDAIEARVEQGQEDVKYGEGTIGTRLANIKALIDVWYQNPIFGIGMHPLWVIKPMTSEESIIAWGFSDVKWASILAAYGIIGFAFAIGFQLYYIYTAFRLLIKISDIKLNYFFLMLFLIILLFDFFINYSYLLTTLGTLGLGSVNSFYIANLVYLFEKYIPRNKKTKFIPFPAHKIPNNNLPVPL